MRFPTLAEPREHIERPVPAVGRRFGNRTTARAVEAHRATLRRDDSRVPYYDTIGCADARVDDGGGREMTVVVSPTAEPTTRVSVPIEVSA